MAATADVAALGATTRMKKINPGEEYVMRLRDALFSDTGVDKDVRLPHDAVLAAPLLCPAPTSPAVIICSTACFL